MARCPFCRTEIADLTAHFVINKECRAKALLVAKSVHEWLSCLTVALGVKD